MSSDNKGGVPGYKKVLIAFLVLVLGGIVWAAVKYEPPTPAPAQPARTTHASEQRVPRDAPYIAPLDEDEVPEDIRYGVPYDGMDVRYISSTGLGPYDESTMVGDSPNYVWYCPWASKEIACIASCDGDKVAFAIVHDEYIRLPNPSDDAQAPGGAGEDDSQGSDAQASADQRVSNTSPSYAPDPYDYIDPDDYAREYEEWASENGSWYRGIYDDAYEEWMVEVAEEGWEEW